MRVFLHFLVSLLSSLRRIVRWSKTLVARSPFALNRDHLPSGACMVSDHLPVSRVPLEADEFFTACEYDFKVRQRDHPFLPGQDYPIPAVGATGGR